MAALGLTLACGTSNGDGDGGGGGTGGTGIVGAGGVLATGGTVAATGGAAAGSGGAAVGSGGAAVGSGGAAVGSGGAAVGTGGQATVVTTTICGTSAEDESATLTCPDGSTITSIEFASFGTSTGACESFAQGTCHAAQSQAIVEAACLGQRTCEVEATNDTFGGDPCSLTLKHLDLQATCSDGTIGGTGGAGSGGGPSTGGAPASGGAPGTGGAAGACPTALVGYATVNSDGVNGTTGGGNATPTVVTTLAQLRSAVQDSAPRVVVVSGTINTTSDGDGYPLQVYSNKTVMGQDENATIVGGLQVNGESNVIITNLNIQGVWPNPGPGDTLSSSGSHHVWFDHLNVWDAEDGLLDITNESDFQTVSWSKFWYTDASHDHRLASLNGSGAGDHPEDWGHLRVTYHHNWFAELVDQRMPRVTYGEGHQFNNYYNSPGNSYCIGVGSYGSILVENNYFKDVNDPILHMYDVYMYSAASGNIFDNTTGAQNTGLAGTRDACPDGDCTIQAGFDPGPFDPPYAYTLRPAEEVPEIVQRCAGPR